MDLQQDLFGTTFQNPVLLAAGTCGFGEELSEVVDLEGLGGIVTKSVTLEPRWGNPAPRVAEFTAGMINSIGLTNPGLAVVKSQKLPWLRDNLRRARVFVSIAGHNTAEFLELIRGLDGEDGFLGFELNLSCPNDERLGGLAFALDQEAVRDVVSKSRECTQRPLLVKLAPNVPDIGETAMVAEAAGADGLTLTNTLPGLVVDLSSEEASLGAGTGGVSGPALRPVALQAVWRARQRTSLPLIGVGGILAAADAIEFLLAGASLTQVGTGSFIDPRATPRIVDGIREYGRRRGLASVGELIGRSPNPERVTGGEEKAGP